MQINKGEIVAIIRGVAPENVYMITKTLIEEGINFVEVSLSDEDAGLACIHQIAVHFSDKIGLGAGTVLRQEQADKAIAAGAKYIITPGWDTNLVRYIKSKNVGIYPGVYSPSEVMQSINEDIEIIKLFPAGDLGINYIKSLLGPFPNIKIMAVGGVTKSNIRDFYNAGCYSFAIGSDLVPRGAGENDLKRIRSSAQEYMNLLKGDL
jgi:2-dehydro-3-deoxyphosphogluconate aldolase / (4S)-4-hydroxy-2-oxoglutarate aldolase